MAPRVSRFVLEGQRALFAALTELGKTFGGAALDAAVSQGMTIVRAEARSNIQRNRSVSPGPRSWPGYGTAPPGQHLYQTMKTVKTPNRPRNNPEFRLGFAGRGRYLAHLVEFGTAPHWQPRRRFMHPGARPFPFMRPAFDTHGPKAIDHMLLRLRDLVLTQAAKLYARNRRR